MFSVNTNLASSNALTHLNQTNRKLGTAFERISSGLRINRAGDDAAGLGVSENLDAAGRSLRQAMRNANDGLSLIETAEGAAEEVGNIVKRMKELAVQSSSETLEDNERAYIQTEYDELVLEVDRIAAVTEFNGVALGDGTNATLDVQVGMNDSGDDRITITLGDLTSGTLTVDGQDLSTATGAQAALTVFDDGGGPDIIPIPNSNVTVEEERSEFFAAHTWRPNDRWSVDSRLAWETSTLTFTGDANQSTELSFWKPSVQVSRSFGGNNQLRLRYYRDVGQLDFDDFVSSTSISDNLINGGNPGLEPQSDWRAELGADLRFPGGVTLGLALTHHDIENVNDLVALTNNNGTPGDPSDDETFDAPGNIGDAEAWSLDVNLTTRVPFIPNSRLTIEGEFWDTEVTDPVTGRSRIISYQPESEVDIGFRQDFAEHDWSWGLDAYMQGEVQGYRLNEIEIRLPALRERAPEIGLRARPDDLDLPAPAVVADPDAAVVDPESAPPNRAPAPGPLGEDQ